MMQMRRTTLVVTLIVCAVSLAACAGTHSNTTKVAGTTPPVVQPASKIYALSQAPDAAGCLATVNGRTLDVQGNVATITNPPGPLLQGSFALQGAAFHVHIPSVQGPKFLIDLTGSVDNSGDLAGKSTFDGTNPGGDTGFSCDFIFVGNLNSGVGTHSDTEALAFVKKIFDAYIVPAGSSPHPTLSGCFIPGAACMGPPSRFVTPALQSQLQGESGKGYDPVICAQATPNRFAYSEPKVIGPEDIFVVSWEPRRTNPVTVAVDRNSLRLTALSCPQAH
jgi:hypothetical protein